MSLMSTFRNGLKAAPSQPLLGSAQGILRAADCSASVLGGLGAPFVHMADSAPFMGLWSLQDGAVLCNTASTKLASCPSEDGRPPIHPHRTGKSRNARIVTAPARQGAL